MSSTTTCRVILRLMPRASKTGPKATMFQVRDATGAELITGRHWGDDYLVITDQEQLAIVKDLLTEADFPFKEVEKLPHYLG